jgi:hypothetical protein
MRSEIDEESLWLRILRFPEWKLCLKIKSATYTARPERQLRVCQKEAKVAPK